MKITLRKVGKTPYNFEKSVENITLKGFLQYDKENLILLDAKLNGSITCDCAMCGESFQLVVDEPISFYISDGIFIDKDSTNIDVYETQNGILDVDELLDSEIELIKSDYHSCNRCQEEKREFSF